MKTLRCPHCGNTNPAKFTVEHDTVTWNKLRIVGDQIKAGSVVEEYCTKRSLHCSECAIAQPLDGFEDGVEVVYPSPLQQLAEAAK